MNDRLILIQSKTQVILKQQLELAEYPAPQLFIVLPDEVTQYDQAFLVQHRVPPALHL